MMKRRDAIRRMFVWAGGLWIATSCDFKPGKASIQLNHVDFNADDELLLARLVDVLIPPTDTPGGQMLHLHLFVMKMVDDCAAPEQQRDFTAGLRDAQKQKINTDKEWLDYLSGLPEKDPFLTLLKSRTIQGYLQSEYVMTQKLVYELVPGRYDGAVRISG